MPGTFFRTLKRAAVAMPMAALALVAVAVPASAHTLEEAVRSPSGCGWSSGGYDTLDSEPVTTGSGTRYGTVYLLWSSTYQQNCVVTLKSSYHGTSTRTGAGLSIQDVGRYGDDGSYAHYAAVARDAAGRCVAYEGYIYSPGGTQAWGGRPSWGNCR
ncbi:hypothetical protein [Marinactinospora rubrisoli]|uniref:Spore-associated protein A n=1 Tax=Marinactinospora rubrisoli TaxID=2715399 RepID=A0ABW2KNU3_9ACTN